MSGWRGGSRWKGDPEGVVGLRPQLGRIRDSVEGLEGYDPSGILVSAEDTAQGCRIEIAGGEGTATPQLGVSWSVPLRDVGGREIGPLGNKAGLPPFAGQFAADEVTAWGAHSAPTNNAYWIGVADGPISGMTEGIFWMCVNGAAGQQSVAVAKYANGAWDSILRSLGGHAGNKGVIAGIAPGNGDSANRARTAGSCYPYKISTAVSISYRVLTDLGLLIAPGKIPHLVFGAGGPTADAIEFGALAGCLGTFNLRTLKARPETT